MNSIARGLVVMACIGGGMLEGFGRKTVYSTRSQAVNASRELAGWQRHINRPDQDDTYGVLSITPEYNRSFNADDIACFLLGGEKFSFTGSQVLERGPDEILADYFGLPSDFESAVCFDPKIVNFVMDFDCFIGMDGIAPGLYARIHLPIVHAKWDLNLCELVADGGTTFTSYPAGYLAADAIELTQLTQGETAPTNVQTVFEGTAVFGDMREPITYGKIFGRQNEVRVADLTGVIGYNFLLGDWYHCGLNLRVAAPTGTLRNAEFYFEPIAGNDHHWELGGGLSFHVDFIHDVDTCTQWGLYVDANISHMFDSTQKRSFDMCVTSSVCCTAPGSRYMLLQEIDTPAVGLNQGLAPSHEAAANQYTGRLVPAINITTLDASIRVDVQADIVAKLYYQRRGFECDLGYNLWVRSKEKLSCRESIPACFALKGDAQLYGFTASGESAVALNATQSTATIFGGQGDGNFVSGSEFANDNADNPVLSSDNVGTGLFNLKAADAATFNATQQTVHSSRPAVLLTDDDIDECSALLEKGLSHKLFFYVGYTYEREEITPYVGLGVFGEWACSCVDDNSAYSQWGVWLKGGLSFS